ncbi:hypothetical protein BD310DRAFT_804921, partial [Dichomitus squalens]
YRFTWDEVHLPHLGSPRHRRETIAGRPCKPPVCRSRLNFTRLTSRHSCIVARQRNCQPQGYPVNLCPE